MEAPHKRLIVWQKAMALARETYEMTKSFPREEQFGLTSQIRRAVVSIASNIAEGAARQNSREKIQFWLIARGSLVELETQIEICQNVGYPVDKTIIEKVQEVGRLLQGLIEHRRKQVRKVEEDN